MKQKTKVIFNNEYIQELYRHRDIAKKKYDVESPGIHKEQAKKDYEYFLNKIEWAENFQDIVEEIHNINIPHLTIVKTMSGRELLLRNLQFI